MKGPWKKLSSINDANAASPAGRSILRIDISRHPKLEMLRTTRPGTPR
jgi:hypothetical protein